MGVFGGGNWGLWFRPRSPMAFVFDCPFFSQKPFVQTLLAKSIDRCRSSGARAGGSRHHVQYAFALSSDTNGLQ